MEKITFIENIPIISEYWELFETTKWNDKYQLSKEELEMALSNSWYSISCYNNDKLIGFGRIISDGIHHALIVDMIIQPIWQGKGIGSKILTKLIKKCNKHAIRDIQLFSASGKSQFYEKHGFKRRSNDSPGMQYVL